MKAFWIVGICVVAIVSLATVLAGSEDALAASGASSCVGIEASSVSPPGSSDELPGGMAQLAHELKGFGGPPGGIVSFIARFHEGSHEACDEAIEG